MIVLGIDPGANGGLAVITGSRVTAFKMPEDLPGIWALFGYICANYGKPDVVYIERLQPMPDKFKGRGEGGDGPKIGRGSIANFKLGRNVGALEAFAIAKSIRVVLVLPRVWQKYMDCLSGGDKKITHARAVEIFPTRKITHANADALLIAEYGFRKEQIL